MLKAICSIGLLEMMLVLTGCAPTAYVVGTVNQPIKYTYAPGFNPPQAAYPDVPVDANTSIDTPAIVQQENAINEMNDTMAIVQQQNQAAQQQAIEQQLNAMTLLH
ncbi:hypothetical protein OQJ18_09320 [Fluoribacter dumoffii]|uniref:Lipoprotein n=1 Tax=Fluoribacter dumoffii TaxID=463 RepID=A0A377G7U7_9GAMM|nr:hypothetical protein [Fluoribacter dumoffii]KTC89441.1 hypothetical protein Ldum_0509 [Fluoribacter dumoffii NY 23]MCW8417702.1 hypothetical protein [Fluoribacter dumoffii]MCW8454456.1 hypothetical protein [Fluoribacter dumoffii]MCW8461470.1 hypothetical protein [Fluoribacter dumoffii]MCW8484908.1 hypothetical protein [Fluoribacter dumoffii]